MESLQNFAIKKCNPCMEQENKYHAESSQSEGKG